MGLKQAKDVVLLGSQVEPTEQFVLKHSQSVVGAPKVEEHLLLQRIESSRTDWGRITLSHTRTISG
jgi:hypothetical protein